MRIAFTRWPSGGLFNRPSPRKRLPPKKKTSSDFEFVSGLADGASAMPAKWNRPAFSFRFYEGKISCALILSGNSRDLRLASPWSGLAGDHAAREIQAEPTPQCRTNSDLLIQNKFRSASMIIRTRVTEKGK